MQLMPSRNFRPPTIWSWRLLWMFLFWCHRSLSILSFRCSAYLFRWSILESLWWKRHRNWQQWTYYLWCRGWCWSKQCVSTPTNWSREGLYNFVWIEDFFHCAKVMNSIPISNISDPSLSTTHHPLLFLYPNQAWSQSCTPLIWYLF